MFLKRIVFLIIVFFISVYTGVYSKDKNNIDLTSCMISDEVYYKSLIEDFDKRDEMPQTDVPCEKWDKCGDWGPASKEYPAPQIPSIYDPVKWKRDRIILVARKYIGLPYMHKHIPSAGGLDCSNFTAWVYNYGLGIKFTSSVVKQGKDEKTGIRIDKIEDLKKGDILLIWNKEKTKIGHAAIYIDENHIIDACKESIEIRAFKGWYKKRFAYAKRVIY